MRKTVFLTFVLMCVSVFHAHAQDPEALSEARAQDGLPYRLFRPATYQAETKYPLVIYLHGAGQRGTNNLSQIKEWNEMLKPLLTTASRTQTPAFIIAPQCPPTNDQKWVDWPWEKGSYDLDKVPESAPMKKVRAAIAALRTEFSIDPDRIYVMGVSMGGFGTWDLVARTPGEFAGAVAADGGTPPGAAASLRNLAVWWFHNADDGTVKVGSDREMFSAMAATGGRPTYSEWASGGHSAMSRMGSNKDVLPWLFAQRRGVPPSSVPGLTFTPMGGSLPTAPTISITSNIAMAKVRFTSDGTVPAFDRGTPYVDPFILAGSVTVQAVAITGQAGSEARHFHAETYLVGNMPKPDGGVPTSPGAGGTPDARPAVADTRAATVVDASRNPPPVGPDIGTRLDAQPRPTDPLIPAPVVGSGGTPSPDAQEPSKEASKGKSGCSVAGSGAGSLSWLGLVVFVALSRRRALRRPPSP